MDGGGNPRMVIMALSAPRLEHEHTAVVIPMDGSQPEAEGTHEDVCSQVEDAVENADTVRIQRDGFQIFALVWVCVTRAVAAGSLCLIVVDPFDGVSSVSLLVLVPAVRSLKRNFSDFCKDITTSKNVKMNTTDGVSRSVFTRYSSKYFVEVIRKLTPEQRSVIAKFGFGCLLHLDLYDIPSEFARWVADCVDPICSQISVSYKLVDISKSTVHLILGLPIDGLEVPCDSNTGKEFILTYFRLPEMPHITFFGNKLCGSEVLSEHDVFVCFMVVAISCFLCPSMKEYPNAKYLSVLKFPDTTRGFDFSKLVYECCLESISQFNMSWKLKGRRPKTPVCCNYVPVHYLDCLDFGRQTVDQAIPRITVWRGSMIRVFSELDRKGRQRFGKRHLKEGLAICRAKGVPSSDVMRRNIRSPIFDPVSYNFRENVHNRFLSNLRADNASIANVQLVGSNDFMRKRNELSKKVDSTYNKLLCADHMRDGLSQGFVQNVQSKAQIQNVNDKAQGFVKNVQPKAQFRNVNDKAKVSECRSSKVDCGVFVMKFMELWKPFLDMRRLFSDQDILNIRIQYAIKLFFLSDNEADLRLVTDYYGKP
ncbi:hypothetical protein ACQ4PT_058109 [Festuca glaucescens]